MEAAVATAPGGQTAVASAKKKTEYEKVAMTDGRVVEFPKGRKLDKNSFITGVDGFTGVTAVRLDFANGETRLVEIPGAELINTMVGEFDLTDSDKARIQHLLRAATHGYEQKLGDEMAYQPKKDEAEPTLEDKIAWVDELIARLAALEWKVAREGGGLAGTSDLITALVALSGKSKEDIQTWLRTGGKDADGKACPMSREERAIIKRTSPIKEKIEEIEAERAAKSGVDGNALVASLGISAA